MKKYLLLVGVSLLMANTAPALSVDEQVKAMREIFVKEFQKMDSNKDGVVSEAEYLNHQFEAFRASIIEADGFNDLKKENGVKDMLKEAEKQSEEKSKEQAKNDVEDELGGISQALKDMAEFDVDFGEIPEVDEDMLALDGESAAVPLNKEDVMPDVNFVVQEEDSIKGLLADVENKVGADTVKKWEEMKPEDQMELMLNSIRKNLPKKIDEITSWIDIEYKDNVISYIYEADVDTKEFSQDEKKILQDSIKNEACKQAYAEMCPQVKPMFIDQGINMKIKYQDKTKQEISFCEFNKDTCQ